MVFAAVTGAILLVAVSIALAWRLRARSGRRPGIDTHRPTGKDQAAGGRLLPVTVSVLCLSCRGRGWIERRERTLTFTGEGFADHEHPPAMCETCGGSGRLTR